MRHFTKHLRIGLFGIVAMAPTIHAQDSLGRIRVGAPFPHVELPSLVDGNRSSITTFHGKPVVLIIFASW